MKRNLNRIGIVMVLVKFWHHSGVIQSECMAAISFKSNFSLILLFCYVLHHFVMPAEK